MDFETCADHCNLLSNNTPKMFFFFFFFCLFITFSDYDFVLTPVSTSGKNSRAPFNGTLPQNPCLKCQNRWLLVCTFPQSTCNKRQYTKHKTEKGSWGYSCVCLLFISCFVCSPFTLCLSSYISWHDIFIYFGY